jgi:hypothetical protein
MKYANNNNMCVTEEQVVPVTAPSAISSLLLIQLVFAGFSSPRRPPIAFLKQTNELPPVILFFISPFSFTLSTFVLKTRQLEKMS